MADDAVVAPAAAADPLANSKALLAAVVELVADVKQMISNGKVIKANLPVAYDIISTLMKNDSHLSPAVAELKAATLAEKEELVADALDDLAIADAKIKAEVHAVISLVAPVASVVSGVQALIAAFKAPAVEVPAAPAAV